MDFWVVFTGLALIITTFYLYIQHKFNYWKKKKIPHTKPKNILGNFKSFLLQKEYLGKTVQQICDQFPKEDLVGAYFGTVPVLITRTPEAVKMVVAKDFSYFNSREFADYSNRETFGKSLIQAAGDEWKFTRTNLTPMFSTMKLRNMYPLIEACSEHFEKYLESKIKDKTFEARDLMASYTLSVFVSCAFGLEIKDLDERNEFKIMGEKFFDYDWFRALISAARYWSPGLFYGLGLRLMPKDLTTFFGGLLDEVFKFRNYKPSPRNDFVDAILALRETAANKKKDLDDDYIIAQCIAIFAGGFETSATTLSNLLFELSKNEDVQDKLHEEIDGFLKKTGGKLSFDCVTDLPYAEACLSEILRMYPIVGTINREVIKEYTLPSGAVLERGLRISLPVYYLHHNPQYFPNPEKFSPERFYGETKQEIVPYSYLPFGEGPRLCIGKRFAMMQTLSGLVTVLRNHKVVLADGMTTKPEFEPKTATTQFKGGTNLKFLPRK